MVPSDSRVVIIQTESEHQGTVAKAVKATAEAARPQHRKTAPTVSFAVSDTSSGPEDASHDDTQALGGYAEPQAKAPADQLQPPIRSQLCLAPSGTQDSFVHTPFGTSMHQSHCVYVYNPGLVLCLLGKICIDTSLV